MTISIPAFTQILVVGGGPAGSYAASVLAREGFDVTLLERDYFPRYHIGESLLPSCRSFLQFIDAEDKVRNYGFTPKPGAAVKLNQHKREGYTDFIFNNPENNSWNVVRSEFDDLLLRHASSCGVRVVEGVSVTTLGFRGDINHIRNSDSTTMRDSEITSATWTSREGSTGTISFDWLVDASGRNGIVSTKYLKTREFNKSLKNIAIWGYWVGGSTYMPGTDRENAPWFEALTDETGWAWFIPLHDGTTSVGVVLSEASNRQKREKAKQLANRDTSLKAHYLNQLDFAPGVRQLTRLAYLVSEDVKSASDYSYSSALYAGRNWRIAGDAGAFIDPFFSSGIHLAFTGGLSAASTISASIRKQCSDEESATFHDGKVGTAYTRFLLVVLSTYNHINSQQSPILSDINEDNFDRAFHILRPVIQGCADGDIDPTLTKEELLNTMDFCKNILMPTQPEMLASVSRRYPSLFDKETPIVSVDEVKCRTQINPTMVDEEARAVLLKENARKIINSSYDGTPQFELEVIRGFVVNMKHGHLGLHRVSM